MALTDLATVKGWLGLSLSATGDDALLTRLITSASDFIGSWLGRTLEEQPHSQQFDGHGGAKYPLREFPVSAVASLKVDGLTIPPAPSATAPGFVLSDNIIHLRGYYFARGVQNCEVTYTAGYASNAMPSEVVQACVELVGLRYKARDRIGVSNKSANGESISFTQVDMTDSIRDMLQPYKKVALV